MRSLAGLQRFYLSQQQPALAPAAVVLPADGTKTAAPVVFCVAALHKTKRKHSEAFSVFCSAVGGVTHVKPCPSSPPVLRRI